MVSLTSSLSWISFSSLSLSPLPKPSGHFVVGTVGHLVKHFSYSFCSFFSSFSSLVSHRPVMFASKPFGPFRHRLSKSSGGPSIHWQHSDLKVQFSREIH